MLVRSQNGSIALLAGRLVLPQRFQWRITTGPMTLAALPSRRAMEPALMAQFKSSAGVSGRSGVITLESTLVTNTANEFDDSLRRSGLRRPSGAGSGRRRQRGRGMVDEFLQSLARLKVGDLFSGHLDPCASLGVGNFPRLALANAKAAEAPDLDLISGTQ